MTNIFEFSTKCPSCGHNIGRNELVAVKHPNGYEREYYSGWNRESCIYDNHYITSSNQFFFRCDKCKSNVVLEVSGKCKINDSFTMFQM